MVPLLPIGTLVKDTRLELALVEEVVFPGIVVVVVDDDNDEDDDNDDDDDEDDEDEGADEDDKFPFELG